MFNRISEINRNEVPIKTWIPWNPVAMKNDDPYDESEIENSAWKYSIAWRREKYIPNKHVILSDIMACNFMFDRIAWWDHVTDAPDLTKMMVLSRGTFIGLKALIKNGGHVWPISNIGLSLEWKYAQKNEEKNNTSEIMNKIIPIFSPFITIDWWNPCIEDSRLTSFHHINDLIRIIIKITIDFSLNDE